jgi:hypothetical protein
LPDLPVSGVPSGGRVSTLLLFRLEPTRPLVAIVVLVVVTAALLALACWVFRAKEYLYEE